MIMFKDEGYYKRLMLYGLLICTRICMLEFVETLTPKFRWVKKIVLARLPTLTNWILFTP
jgi:hypothetical protein